jgi:hypothetical protein
MKRCILLITFMMILSVIGWARGNKDQQNTTEQQHNKQKQISPAQIHKPSLLPPTPTNPYFTGEGGKGMSLAISIPQSQGLNANQSYIPTLVQGILAANLSKYSAISVLDRVSLERVINQTLDPTFEDNLDIIRLGHVAQVGNWLTGNIIKTSIGYTLQINITETTSNGITIASHTGNYTVVQFDDHSAINIASLALLEQIGVQLTLRAKNELEQANTSQQINARIALSQGIVAQQHGTVVEALSYFYEATAFDPTVLEAANRASVITVAITSGNIGENVRNDIQHRNEWLKILREAANFFKTHPPYEIIYDPALIEGNINYSNETVDIYLNLGIRAKESSYKIIKDILLGLQNTGKSIDWGFSNWPESGAESIFIESILNYQINVILSNGKGTTIGRSSSDFKGSGLSFSHDFGTIIFRNVNVNAISDELKISIISVNNEETVCVLRLSITSTIFTASGYSSSSSHLIRYAQSFFVRCGNACECRQPASGSVKIKILHVPNRMYS